MWFKNIFSRRPAPADEPLFGEAFLLRLERLSLQAQRTLRGRLTGGEHLSRHQLPATIFSDHRPYSAGDDYRYIDWNAYAHQDQIFVRLGEVEQSIAVHVLVDVSRSMAYPPAAGRGIRGAATQHITSHPPLRRALELAAALGYLALAHHDRLHIAPFSSALHPQFGPAQGKGRVHDLLRFLGQQRADQPTALGQVLSDYARRHQRGGMLVICSDLLVPAGLAAGLRLLPPPRWQVLVLHLADPAELRPQAGGPIELEDAETGERMALTLDAPTLAAYRRNLAVWHEQIAHTCARHGAAYAQLPADWPLERQVLPFLRARRYVR